MSDEQTKIKFDGVQLVAGALTAVTSALLLSTVGVAGTLLGVAVGSVLGTVGNAVYTHYLSLSRRRVAAAKVLADARARGDGAHGGGVAVREAHEELAQADVDPARAREGDVSWREVVRGVPWRRILPVTVVVGVVALAAILVFELAAGRALSTYTGGSDEPRRTTISGVNRDQPAPDREPQQSPQPQPEEAEPSDPPTLTPEPTTEPAPTDTADPEPTQDPAPLDESEVPEPEPSPEPSSTP